MLSPNISISHASSGSCCVPRLMEAGLWQSLFSKTLIIFTVLEPRHSLDSVLGMSVTASLATLWEGHLFPQTSFPTLVVPFLGTTLWDPVSWNTDVHSSCHVVGHWGHLQWQHGSAALCWPQWACSVCYPLSRVPLPKR